MKEKLKNRSQQMLAALVAVLMIATLTLALPIRAQAVNIARATGTTAAQMDTSEYSQTVQLPVTLYDYGRQVDDTWVSKDPTILNEGVEAAKSSETSISQLPKTMRFWDTTYEQWNLPYDYTSFVVDDGDILKGGGWGWGLFSNTFSSWNDIIEAPSRDLFGKSEYSCYYNGQQFKKVYQDIPMEFSYDPQTNSYHYSSDESCATFDGEVIHKNERSGQNSNIGFWPFGEGEVHFGLSMDFDFYLPSQQYLDSNEYYFAFSGDDDLVVYVDDKLALDLGGAHPAIAGYIDFANQIVVYNKNSADSQNEAFLQSVEQSDIPFYRSGFDEAGINWNMETLGYVTFADLGINLSNNATHNFKLAYLERGGYASNLSIEMNMVVQANVDYQVVGDVSPQADLTSDVPTEIESYYLYDGYSAQPAMLTEDANYIFDGWYADQNCQTPWQDGAPLTSTQTTLYGKWVYCQPLKTSDPESGTQVHPEQQITYTVSYTNEQDEATSVTIADYVPEHTTYVENSVAVSSPDATIDLSQLSEQGTGVLMASWSELQPGQTAKLSFAVKVDKDAVDQTISNVANVALNDGQMVFVTNKVEHPVVADSEPVVTPVIDDADTPQDSTSQKGWLPSTGDDLAVIAIIGVLLGCVVFTIAFITKTLASRRGK